MKEIEVDNVAINLRLLKLCRFYQMFDPNSAKFLNINVYQFLGIVFTAFILCVIFFGHVGMFTNKDETLKDIDLILSMFPLIFIYFGMVKISVLLYKANKVWDLFDIARLDFLTSKQCRKNINTLYECRDWIIKTSNYLAFIILAICIQWILFPFVVNLFDHTVNCRKQNAINIPFPVSIDTYNKYYVIFYIIEIMLTTYSGYLFIVFDILIMSFCWVITILYQILIKSFADVGYAKKPQLEHYEDFKSILSDQIQLNLKLKSFYDITRPIMLIYVGLSLCLIITVTYVSITVICTVIIGNNEGFKSNNHINPNLSTSGGIKNVWLSLGSYSAFQAITLGTSAIFVYFELFIFCYIFDRINTYRDSVNFGMYSSNWTMMDLKFKKLLLLAMRMNDANKIEIKASPNKIINLQLFANVMKICYNVTSVLLKTMNKNKSS